MANIEVNNAPFINKQFIVTTPFSQSHHALDLAPYGFAGDLYAIDHFVLTYKGTHSSYGNYAIFSNENGVMYLYAHMLRLPTKNVGDTYNNHEYIAPAGSTGTSTGVHLHLEMQRGGAWVYNAPFSDYINPCDYLTGIINVASQTNVYIYDGTPVPPTPVQDTSKSKFKWVLYARKLRTNSIKSQ